MWYVPVHEVQPWRIARALHDIEGRAERQYLDMRHGSVTLGALQDLRNDLLDYVAAHVGPDPALSVPTAREALLTAAECSLGVLNFGCFPDGDWDVPLPLIAATLTSVDQLYDEEGDPTHAAATAPTWLDAFRMSLISGLLWERNRVIGPLLVDYASAVRDGAPYSRWASVSAPADLAELDALGDYLHIVKTSRSPWVAQGPVPVRRPDAERRERAAARLDAAGELSRDQRLLRVLLDDDQARFEQALVERLMAHGQGQGADPAARSLLPVSVIALAALAVLAHGWDLRVGSDYLPAAMLRAPQHAAAD